MSRTGEDPHAVLSKGPVAKASEEIDRLKQMELKGQWAMTRSAGLTVHIFQRESSFGEVGAWVSADEVEKLLRDVF